MMMIYRWLYILDYVKGREHRLSLIRFIGLCWTLRRPMWVVVYTLWWACIIDSLFLLAHLFMCCLCLYYDCGSIVRISLYLWWCTLICYLLICLCDNWVNQYHALCHLNHVSLIELSIEIFYEHLNWSCIILDPFTMYVSIFEVDRLTW